MDVIPLKLTAKPDGIQNKSALLQPGPKRVVVVGASSSGKTYFSLGLFTQMIHEPFSVYIFTKTPEQTVYKDIEKWCDKKDIPYVIDNCMKEEYFAHMYADDCPTLCIWDDFNKQIDDTKHLNIMYRNGRQKNIYVMTISQDLTSVDKNMRINATNLVIFPMASSTISRSMLQQAATFISPESLKEAYKYICKPENKYSCIFLSSEGSGNVIIHKDFSMVNLLDGQALVLPKKEKRKMKRKDIKDAEISQSGKEDFGE